MEKDNLYIEKTFQLAARARGFTSPNPMVGAVIVKKNKICAVGFHKRCGQPHAEIQAIKKLDPKTLSGSTIYINLEPCFCFGHTSPCVDMIIEKKIKRVVISSLDPNPKTKGKSVRKLRSHGIEVKTGVLKFKAKELNEIFFKNMTKGLPFVAAKFAQSLDGKIATASHESKWITQKKTRDYAKGLRDKYDAVLVGVNTVNSDDPKLYGGRRALKRIVIDPNLRINPKSRIVRENPDKLILITLMANLKKAKKLNPKISIIGIRKTKQSCIDLKQALKKLYANSITSIFVEGGSFTLGRFFQAGLVDKAYIFLAPIIIGGKDSLSSVGAKGCESLTDAAKAKTLKIQQIGRDLLLTAHF